MITKHFEIDTGVNSPTLRHPDSRTTSLGISSNMKTSEIPLSPELYSQIFASPSEYWDQKMACLFPIFNTTDFTSERERNAIRKACEAYRPPTES